MRSGDRDRRGQPRRPSSRAADALERPAPGRGGPAGQGHLRGRKRSPRLFASRLCRAGPPPAQQSNPQPRPGRLRRPRSGPRGASRRRAADGPPGRHTLEPDRSGCLREELGATTRSTPPSKKTRTVRLPDVPHVGDLGKLAGDPQEAAVPAWEVPAGGPVGAQRRDRPGLPRRNRRPVAPRAKARRGAPLPGTHLSSTAIRSTGCPSTSSGRGSSPT